MSETDAVHQERISERENLNKLLRFLENGSIHFEAKKKVLAATAPISTTPRTKTVFIDKWPEPAVRKEKTVLFPSLSAPTSARSRLIGGTPITLETAIVSTKYMQFAGLCHKALRKVILGNAIHPFSPEWRRSSLTYQYEESPFPYGLQTQRCGSRGVALCLQAFILKHMMYTREYISSMYAASLLKPNSFERRRCQLRAMAEMLWQAGEKQRACVCLTQELPCFDPDFRHRSDGLTERLYLFEFKKYEDLEGFIRRNLEQFDKLGSPGCILFLYSIILSRTIPRVYQDQGVGEDTRLKLVTDMEECTQPLINLLLTGKAVRFLHNGELLYDRHGNLLPQPFHGVESRSELGFLFWDKGEEDDMRTEVGSMLKTPKFPVWVTKVNGQFGLLFSTNPDLVNHWRAENRFVLYYYTGLSSQNAPCTLSIDTRVSKLRPKTGMQRKIEEEKIPPLEKCIQMKWPGSSIKWNGILPFY